MVGDLRGTITEANDAFLEIVGYSREDFDAGYRFNTRCGVSR